MTTPFVIELKLADEGDALAITELLNASYRSGNGWTHEKQLVAGSRAQEAAIREIIATQLGVYLLLFNAQQLLACIHIEPFADGAMIGSFAVRPDWQGAGIGAGVLKAGEEYAMDHFAAAALYMDVLAPRKELIAYYERKGYCLTGEQKDFPLEVGAGTPFDAKLKVVRLVKRV